MKRAFCHLFFVLLVNIDTLVSVKLLNPTSPQNQRRLHSVSDYVPLVIILSIIVSIIGIACVGLPIILMPQFQISLNKIPLLLVGLIFVKDVLLYEYISSLRPLFQNSGKILNFFIVTYANLYILRQLKIILLKDNRLAKSVNYIQYYALFWSLSLFISEILIKFMNLSMVRMILIVALGQVLMGVLAYGISKSFFGDYPEIEQDQPVQNQRRCNIFKGNKGLCEILSDAKVLSKLITQIVPMLILPGLTYQFCSIQARKWSSMDGTISLNNAFGIGIVVSTAVFSIFLKRSIKHSAIIIILINVLINFLVQIEVSSSLLASLLMVLSGFACYLIYIWSFSAVMLLFEGKYELFALIILWMNLGGYCIQVIHIMVVSMFKHYFTFEVFQFICNIAIGILAIIYIGKFQSSDRSFKQKMDANLKQVSLSQRSEGIQISRQPVQGERSNEPIYYNLQEGRN